MQTIEYRFMDRTNWRSGLWDGEPDKVQWQDEETGLPCLAVRNGSGAWCGYVGVAEGHPWFEQHYREHEDVEVHGGITFSDFCVERDKEHGICHIPDTGEPENVWWFGFDCAHSFDVMPQRDALLGMRDLMNGLVDGFLDLDSTLKGERDEYRTLAYVKSEVVRLAVQIKAAA